MGIVFFILTVLALSGLAFWMYRATASHYEARVIERYEESRREEQRRKQTALGVTPSAAETGAAVPAPVEIEGVPVEVFEAECSDVLAQIAQRRRELRQPRQRRYAESD